MAADSIMANKPFERGALVESVLKGLERDAAQGNEIHIAAHQPIL